MKDCLLDISPLGLSETSLNLLIFSWINPLVLQKSKLFMKVSLKADRIPYPELKLIGDSGLNYASTNTEQ